MKTKNMNTNTNKSLKNNYLADVIINDPESKMRVAIKKVEESVKNDSKNRMINAPLTIEERVLLNF